MITYIYGDLFQSPAKVLVNAVNTVGVMGKGIALDFKKIYPEMFQRYQALCENGQFSVGQLWLYKTPHKWILNFPTKQHWRNPSRIEYIETGLQNFAATYEQRRIDSISFPLLGCGNGELDWETQVRPLMEKYLGGLPIPVYIHSLSRQKQSIAEHRNFKEIKTWLRSEPRNLAFSEVWDDLVTLISEGLYLETANDNERFQVRINLNEDRGIEIIRSSKPVLMAYDLLVDLWQQLRAAGYLNGQSFTAGLDQYARYLMPLFSRLDYVQAVETSFQGIGVQQALQLVAPAKSQPRQELVLEHG